MLQIVIFPKYLANMIFNKETTSDGENKFTLI